VILQADGKPREAHALVGSDGSLLLSDICTSERGALELRQRQMLHQPQRGAFGVKKVLVTVTALED
jgi:hypothetical protein